MINLDVNSILAGVVLIIIGIIINRFIFFRRDLPKDIKKQLTAADIIMQRGDEEKAIENYDHIMGNISKSRYKKHYYRLINLTLVNIRFSHLRLCHFS